MCLEDLACHPRFFDINALYDKQQKQKIVSSLLSFSGSYVNSTNEMFTSDMHIKENSWNTNDIISR